MKQHFLAARIATGTRHRGIKLFEKVPHIPEELRGIAEPPFGLFIHEGRRSVRQKRILDGHEPQDPFQLIIQDIVTLVQVQGLQIVLLCEHTDQFFGGPDIPETSDAVHGIH
ncbi:MAG: hypothetical protein BWY49_00470 [Candidatus Omnitrophica bacterium ADurb.Bin314]|nr:MAG: hypothetical protein BWY49_00470 [Candidatus Omnitrophica bacterium ADurb.Bin314]